MPRLILDQGRPDERAFDLREGVTTIGRASDADVVVPHPSLSRVHAHIRVEGDAVLLEDLGSKNGTFVDGVRVVRCPLGRSHVLRLGAVTFAFTAEDAMSSTAWQEAPWKVHDPSADPLNRSLDQLIEARRAASGTRTLMLGPSSPVGRDHRSLEILLKVSELLSSPAAIDDLLRRVLDLAFEILDVDRGTVVVLEDGRAVPRVTRARPGVPEQQAYSRQIVDHVLGRGMAALFSDTHRDARLRMEGSILQQSIVSAMCAPLRAGDQVLGALYVDNVSMPDCFDEQDLALFSAFASQAAIALHNATLSSRLAQEAITRSTLMRFFPPTAIDAIVRGSGALDTREIEATALFCDLSGYTEISSRMAPTAVIEMLNHYFPALAEIVFRHEGTLEKYIGDALLAIWGAPVPHPDDPERAVRAAVDMQRAVRDLASSGRLPASLAVHIGINTGPVAAGSIGSEHYLQFATVGDATNVASRICGLAAGGEIMVGAGTAARLGPGWTLVPLDPIVVKGKAEPLSVARVRWDGA